MRRIDPITAALLGLVAVCATVLMALRVVAPDVGMVLLGAIAPTGAGLVRR